MSIKRAANLIQPSGQTSNKRPKTSNDTRENVYGTNDISSGAQIQKLLTFSQDSSKSIQNIQSFKLFLDGLTSENNTAGIIVLKEFFNLQQPIKTEQNEEIFLSDLMQTWSFASQSNNEKLLSAVPAVLALLLKTISSYIDLTPFGLKIGKTLLLRKQQELIGRSLIANKNREFILSPILRLLRELSMYDGGSLANYVFKARSQTFKGLTRNLNLRYTGDGKEDLRKPSVRSNAVRFVLQLLKYLSVESKKEFLNQRDIISGLTRDIRYDPAFLVRDVLETLKTHVIMDVQLTRDAKSKILTPSFLGRIASLYSCDWQEDLDSSKASVVDITHEFLLTCCTSINQGALLVQSGLYPKGTEPDSRDFVDKEGGYIDLGLDSIEWLHKFDEKIPVRNVILLEFIQTLRPWSCIKQAELILSIFKSAPELIAEYFLSKKDFSFDPKLTTTWVGYSSFVFGVIQIPLPEYFGYHDKYAQLPPPSSIIIGNVLPHPLNHKVLVRSFSPSVKPLATYLVVKILCAALQKLKVILNMYEEASKSSLSSIWNESASRIMKKVTERLPAVNIIITAYRRLDKVDLIQRHAYSNLLNLYYEVLPQIISEPNSGIPSVIGESLLATNKMSLASQDDVLRVLELENMIILASSIPEVKWLSKGKGLSVSPFLIILKLSAIASLEFPMFRLKSVLASIVEETQLLQTKTNISALDCLIVNLKDTMINDVPEECFEFIDSCFIRCAGTPIKYIFMLEELVKEINKDESKEVAISLISLAFLEQWPFFVKTADNSSLHIVASFISRHLATSIKIQEDPRIIKRLIEKFTANCPVGSAAAKLIENSNKLINQIKIPNKRYDALGKIFEDSDKPHPKLKERLIAEKEAFKIETDPERDLKLLVSWNTRDIEEVIEDGHLASLIMLLSSKYLEVRKETVTNLSKIAFKLKDSNFGEKEQIWLLLSEISETAKTVIDVEPLPSVISAFASHAVNVLKDPSHFLFPKLNKFLLRGPIWRIDKIPLMHRIMDEAPSITEKSAAEKKWLLMCIYKGLRSKSDLGLYRKVLVFEKLLSSYNNYSSPEFREQVIKILFRACMIDEGSTTLITRFSTLTWLEVQQALASSPDLKSLHELLISSFDKDRIKQWSKGTIQMA
ncbi:BgTH12-00293 [Blumeria graminis f. sp. triticale]|uniref:Ribosome biogenesis protein Urb1 n=4 Tax=Blumeria graminis TaxID=34373 RepID=A0A656KQC0_BLUGR|nr:hypothetical protein BGT96224_151 [Blumeria graminis f. sp. tritici 96224]CAD6504790.1 BgTH12-00293 [Blumeria graminis f. sp. triticale]VDB92814.1 Bgt-151 [Blumeria graminis f. sp. tritici]